MNTIVRHEDEKTKAGVLDIIGAPISAITGILMLFYPFVVTMANWGNLSATTGSQVVKVSLCVFFSFAFLIPRATQTFLRSRESWFGSILVRLILVLVFAWICFKFIESQKYYPWALDMLTVDGFEKAYLFLFSVWAFFYLVYFVVPGQYFLLLRHRHNAPAGQVNSRFIPPSRDTTSMSLLNAVTNHSVPKFARVIGGSTIVLFVLLAFASQFSQSYPSTYAMELYQKYKYPVSLYLLIALFMLLFLSADASGNIRLVVPKGLSLSIIPAIVFMSWLFPTMIFQRVLPAYYHMLGPSVEGLTEFDIRFPLPRADERRCKRGVWVLDPNSPDLAATRLCNVPLAIYEDLAVQTSITISTKHTVMGYALGEIVGAK